MQQVRVRGVSGAAALSASLYEHHRRSAAVLCDDSTPAPPAPAPAPAPGAAAAPVFSVYSYAANRPCEDRFAVKRQAGVRFATAAPSAARASVFAVFDGHGGWQVAEWASQRLLPNIEAELLGSSRGFVGGGAAAAATAAAATGGMLTSSSVSSSAVASVALSSEDSPVAACSPPGGGRERRPAAVAEPNALIARALARGFERTDRDYAAAVRAAFDAGYGEVAKVGACAIVAIVVPPPAGEGGDSSGGGGGGAAGGTLYVANAGDCRAVLGRRRTLAVPGGGEGGGEGGGDGTAGAAAAVRSSAVQAVTLSTDHNAKLPAEKARLLAEHGPFGEEGAGSLVACKSADACYVKGRLQPTRGLGDLYLKHGEFNGPPHGGADDARLFRRARGRHVPPPHTPPYVHAAPSVVAHAIDPSGFDELLVMGSDGLWDFVSAEEAVAFVAARRDARRQRQAWAEGEEGAVVGVGAGVGGDAAAEGAGGEGASLAEQLAQYALDKAAAQAELSPEELRALPAGSARRNVHDDTTVIVVELSPPCSGISPRKSYV